MPHIPHHHVRGHNDWRADPVYLKQSPEERRAEEVQRALRRREFEAANRAFRASLARPADQERNEQ